MYGNKWFIMRGNNSQACTLINCPKQHNNPLNVPKITNRRAKSQIRALDVLFSTNARLDVRARI